MVIMSYILQIINNEKTNSNIKYILLLKKKKSKRWIN